MKFEAVPAELTKRDQWLLWSHESDPPKKPLNSEGYGASWTDPSEWLSFDEVVGLVDEDDRFDGIGYVINEGDPYIGLDLDGCLREAFAPKPKDWLPALDAFHGTYIEYSQSGTGLHPFVEADRLPTWWSDVHFEEGGHEGVEAYTEKFFIVTGQPVDELSGPTIQGVDISGFLAEATEAITGEEPRLKERSDRDGLDHDVDVYDVISELSYPEGENRAHPFHGSDTGSNFRVDEGGETFRCWRHGVTGNALHLIGIEQGVISCGEWDGGLDASTWSDIFDAGREAGYALPEPSRRREPIEADVSGDWTEIQSLYAGDEDAQNDKKRARHRAARIVDRNFSWAYNEDSDVIYRYDPDEGFYKQDGMSRLRELLSRRLGSHYTSHERKEIADRLRGWNSHPKDDFGGPDGLVPVENGVLHVQSRDLGEHRPEYLFTSKLPVEFDPDAECPKWCETIGRSAGEDVVVDTFQEFCGYLLHHWGVPYHRALFLVGPTGSGKSTALKTIESILGERSVSSLDPQEIIEDDFAAYHLYGKIANIVGDISEKEIAQTGMFKKVIDASSVYVQDKFKPGFFHSPTAKHIYAANRLPEAATDDDAFFRRALLIGFPEAVPAGERIPNYEDELLEEAPGILNWMLDGYDRLREEGGFSIERTPTETRELWRTWANPLDRFLFDACILEPEETINKKVFHASFINFCEEEGLPTPDWAQRELTEQMHKHPRIETTVQGGSRHFKGVNVKETWYVDPRRR